MSSMDINNNNNNVEVEDDGTLAFLNLPRPEGNKQFHCDVIAIDELVNKVFYVVDYQPAVKTRYGENRYLVNIKFELGDSDDKARKFFTNSVEIKDVLDKIKALNKFPRKVTLRKHKKSYWFE